MTTVAYFQLNTMLLYDNQCTTTPLNTSTGSVKAHQLSGYSLCNQPSVKVPTAWNNIIYSFTRFLLAPARA